MAGLEQDFMMINLSAVNRGILKTIGNREIVVDMKVIEGAREEDNMWLMEQAMCLYKAYYDRVTGGKGVWES